MAVCKAGKLLVGRTEEVSPLLQHHLHNEKQHATTGRESEHLGCKAIVERSETFLSGDEDERLYCVPVFGDLAGDLGCVLYPALD